MAPLLGLSYFADSAFIEWLNFGRVAGLDRSRSLLVAAAGIELAIAAIFVWVYGRLATQEGRTGPLRLAVILVGITALGASSLPLGLRCDATSGNPGASRLASLAGGRQSPSPLLLVGIDSANWRTLNPMVERKALPTFERLIARGLHGEVHALPPPYWSAPAWAAIVTGVPYDIAGIHEDLAATAPGLPPFEVPLTLDLELDPILAFEYALLRMGVVRLFPHPRTFLKRPPFWELLSQAGVESAVVRFPFTFPANGQADFVISNWAGADEWGLLGVHTESNSELASPPALDSELRTTFSGKSPEDARILAELLLELPPQGETDSVVDPVEVLRLAESIDRRTLEASENLIRSHPEIEVLAVYLGGFDSVCHAFWQYRFPEDFPSSPPSAAGVRAFGPVIDRYLEFLDRGLAHLIGAYKIAPTVLVVADHGHEAIHTHMLWKGWHAAHGGIFLAAGPGISPRAEKLQVSYLDIVPTILELEGFTKPKNLPGRSLLGTLRPK